MRDREHLATFPNFAGLLRFGTRHADPECMAGVRDYHELDVYKLADDLEKRVAVILARPEIRRDTELYGQLKRASEGPCPNIAEGFARYLPRDNARFVRIAKGSFSEIIVLMTRAVRKGLTGESESESICRLARRARGAATGYIRYLERASPPDEADQV